jgi:hypothetical protein
MQLTKKDFGRQQMRRYRITVLVVGVVTGGAVLLGGAADAGAAPAAAGSRAIEVPGLAALNADGRAEVLSVSCGPAGACAAGGYYYDRQDHQQGFVVSEQDGTWGKAIPVPGLALLNVGGTAGVTSLSCGSAGNCAAGGYYKDAHADLQGFVVSELNGTWGKATEPPGLAALNAGGAGRITSVSCVPAGNCAAGGSYLDGHRHGQGFVASELSGTWGNATKVPGLVALNAGGSAKLLSLACSPTGNCAAGGTYLDHKQDQQGFVATEQSGTWGKAMEVPGLASLNAGVAQVNSVSCDAAGNCAGGGYYQDRHRNVQGFVVSQS